MLLLELALLALAGLIISDLIGGQSSKANVFEFLGYLLGVLILPIAALFWALVEKNRFSTLILAGASLAVLVMVARMNQLWFG
jgi:type III secretory pathway component EscU